MADQPNNPEQNKIHVDTDWKAQAQAEKQKLQEQAAQEEQQGEGGQPGEMPPADFKTLVSTIVSQALLYMGAIPDPSSGQRVAHPDLARHHIDMLGVIEEKTKGNLDEEEEKLVSQALSELRQHFVQFKEQIAQAQAQQAAGGGQQPGGQGGAGPIQFG